MIKTGKELAEAALNVAKNYKTLYVLGCFGAPLTEANKSRWKKAQAYNRKEARVAKIDAARADTFGFDCVCLIKALLWGWSGNADHVYGGVAYASNGVPDIDDGQMINSCAMVSTDFSNIEVGEAVWLPGHIGIYVGDGLVVEATPSWKDGVQITACNRTISGYNRRDWVKHGRLPWITYTGVAEAPVVASKGVNLPTLRKGDDGEDVRALQILLMGRGEALPKYGADGDFGAETETALKYYQADNSLEADGICGPLTWGKLLGVK